MAIEKQKVNFGILAGIDTKSDSFSVQAPTLLEAENITYQKTGAATKRFGNIELTNTVFGSSSLTSATNLSARNNELVLTNDTNIYSFASDANKWIDKDTFRHWSSSSIDMASDGRYYYAVKQAISGNTIAYVYTSIWNISAGLTQRITYFLVKDIASQTILYENTILPNVDSLLVGVPGGYVFTASGTAYFFDINTLTITNSVANAAFSFTRALITDGTFLFTACSTGGNITVYKTNLAFSIQSSFAQAVAGTRPDLIVLNFEGAYLRCTYSLATAYDIRSFTRLAANLATIGHADVLVLASVNATEGLSAIQVPNSTTSTQIFYTKNANTGRAVINNVGTITTTPDTFILYSTVISQGITVNGKNYLGMCNSYLYASDSSVNYSSSVSERSIDSTYFLVEIDENLDYRVVSYFMKGTCVPNNTVEFSSGIGVLFRCGPFLVEYNNQIIAANRLYSEFVNLDSPAPYQATVLSSLWSYISTSSDISTVPTLNCLLYNGAVPQWYDGDNAVEQGFINRPQITKITASPVLGGTPLGTYALIAVYAWRDAQGNLHRSAPSDAQTITLTGGSSVSLTATVAPPMFSNKPNVEIELYMTEVGGSVYYKQVSQFVLEPHIDDPSEYEIFFDFASLSTAGELLYTTGGALPYDSLPPSYHITQHKNRIFSIDHNQKLLWYSQEIAIGSPVAFSDFFYLDLNNIGNIATAVASLDNYLVVFKENGVFAITGEGPTNLGTQNDYGQPQLVTTDTGCKDKNSIAAMPQGLMFNSPKGIYLLNRSLTASYIGASVESYNGTCYDAILMPETNEVRFAMANGIILMFDYYTNRWATFVDQNPINMILDTDGDVYYAFSNGTVTREITDYNDNGAFIPMSLTTAWISLAAIQGYERFYKLHILGHFVSSHLLKVSIAYDFVDEYVDTVTINTNDLTSTQLYELIIRPSRQKCTSFKVKIEDQDNGVSGESLILSNLAAEIGIKRGNNKRSAGYNFGTTT